MDPSRGNDRPDMDSERSGKSLDSDVSIGGYNMLKILNNLLYLATLCLTIGYWRSMKFTSKFVYYAFEALLIARPALILFYALFYRCRS